MAHYHRGRQRHTSQRWTLTPASLTSTLARLKQGLWHLGPATWSSQSRGSISTTSLPRRVQIRHLHPRDPRLYPHHPLCMPRDPLQRIPGSSRVRLFVLVARLSLLNRFADEQYRKDMHLAFVNNALQMKAMVRFSSDYMPLKEVVRLSSSCFAG